MIATRRYLRKSLALLMSGALVFACAPGTGVLAQYAASSVQAWADTGDSSGSETPAASEPVELTSENCTVSVADQTYTGSPITPQASDITVTYGNTKLVAGTDFTVQTASTGNTAIGVGEGTVTIQGTGTYTGTITAHFSILRADITEALFTVDNANYNGQAHEPNPTVTLNDRTLAKDTDYTIAYANNIDVGTATVTITGIGNYQGTATRDFLITAKEIKADNVTIATLDNYTYDATPKKPEVTVRDGETTLAEGTDYTVAYADNTAAGTATVTVTGTGLYSGTVTNTFTIQPIAVEDSNVSLATETFTYDGTEKEPKAIVKASVNGTERTLVEGTDYDIKYDNNVKAKTGSTSPKATITCKGNYTGAFTREFDIVQAALKADMVELSTTDFAYKAGSEYKPEVTVVLDGAKLENSKYTLTYRNNECVSPPSSPVHATVEVQLTDSALNYNGSVTKDFVIRTATPLASNAYDVTLASTSYTYDGTAKEPAVAVKPKSSGTALVAGTDYRVDYFNNVNAGKAHVKVTGQGSYAESIDVEYNIAQLALSDASLSPTVASATYTGEALTPKVTLKLGKTALVLGKDYTVVYASNTLAGTNAAKATLTAVTGSNFTGTREVPFTIKPISLTKSNTTVVLSQTQYNADGKAKEPGVTVTYKTKDALLVKGQDYTVAYSNNVDNGTGKVTVTGKGNYAGSVTADFTILESPGIATAADRVEANKVVSKIKALGTVTSLTKKDSVTAARTAYEALTPLQKTVVTNYADLTAAETAIKNLEAAKATTDLIAAIGKVTSIEPKGRVKAARAAYDALDASQKKLVTAAQLKTLTDAETKIATYQQQEDRKAAQNVSGLITALGTITSLDSKAAVQEARAAYTKLTDDQRKLVTNYAELTAAEAAIADLEAAKAVIDKIEAIGQVDSLADAEGVEAVRALFGELTPAQQLLVTNIDTLAAAEGMVAKLALELAQPAKGAKVAAGSGASAGTYEVSAVAQIGVSGTTFKAGAVAYQAVPSKNTKTVAVPATVEVAGATYRVTSIAANAFKGSAATSVTVGKNVAAIGAKSLAGASKLKSLTLGAGVKKIAAKAFKANKKLATITVKTKKLTKSSVKNSLKGSTVKTVKVKVSSTKKTNAKYVKKYKKLFTKKVAGKNATVK